MTHGEETRVQNSEKKIVNRDMFKVNINDKATSSKQRIKAGWLFIVFLVQNYKSGVINEKNLTSLFVINVIFWHVLYVCRRNRRNGRNCLKQASSIMWWRCIPGLLCQQNI
ncbi:hypothetical protein DDM80_17805 [Vibrio cholerae]|nr:hypothetical protein [Vibrio cholerae]